MPTPPRIYTTDEWGAKPVSTAFGKNAMKGIVIHNTEDANRAPLTGKAEETAAFKVAVAIQKHHMGTNGWSDTGQSFTVSRGGLILEGRTGSAAAARQGLVVRGAHASGVSSFNETFFGIELEGDNRVSYAVSVPQWDATVELCAWLCHWGGVTPDAKSLVPHKDVLAGHTDCPGELYGKMGDLRTAVTARLAGLGNSASMPMAAAAVASATKPKVIAKVKDSAGRDVDVYQLTGESPFFYLSAMSVDADGAPHAYHPGDYPKDQHIGLDNPAHAGRPGDWWALATDNDKPSGTPLVQKSGDPAPGYWISMTALSSGPWNKPDSYVDAERIPYFVMPKSLGGARKGDFGIVFNTLNKKYTGAIFADTNPAVGESSIACAEALGISKDARNGGTSEAVVGYLVFAGSGNAKPRALSEVLNRSAVLLEDWGGAARLEQLLNDIA